MRIPFFGKKATQGRSAARAIARMMGLGSPVWTPRNYKGYAEEGYQKNIIVFRCIHLIASNASSVPWNIKVKGEIKNDHPAAKLLNSPNPTMTADDFLEACVAYRLISGNRYIQQVSPGPGRPPLELWPLRPDRMKVIPGRGGVPAGWTYQESPEKDPQPFENDYRNAPPILHSKLFNPLNDWYGQSPLEAAAMSVDSHSDATRWNKNLLQNNVRPSGVLQQKGSDQEPMGDDVYNRLKAELDESYSGSKSAGRPMILEGGLEWVQMMLSHVDIDWSNSKRLSATEIALAFNVAEQLVGVPGQQTYNNYREARLALWEDAVLPELYDLMAELTRWFRQIYKEPTLELCIDEDKIPALAPRREALWDKVNKSDDLTINEKRQAKGYDAVKGGDVILVPANLLPLDFAVGGFGDSQPPPSDEAKTDAQKAHEAKVAAAIAYGVGRNG